MSKLIDLTGLRFGRLVVLRRVKNKGKATMWLCQCDCGTIKEIRGDSLKRGLIISCGCLQKEKAKQIGLSNKKHGLKHTRLYSIYIGMKQRCYNKNCESYKWYGERGIKICDEWLKNFISFYNWSMSNNYDDNLSIDRINANGNYEPNNCRWVTMKQQQRNKRNNLFITFNNEKFCLKELVENLGLNYNIVSSKIQRGATLLDAISYRIL